MSSGVTRSTLSISRCSRTFPLGRSEAAISCRDFQRVEHHVLRRAEWSPEPANNGPRHIDRAGNQSAPAPVGTQIRILNFLRRIRSPIGLLPLAAVLWVLSATAQQAPATGLDPFAEARRLMAAGAIDSAISVLREFIAREPRSADAYLLLGTALSLVPRRSEAIAAIEKAIELRPGSAAAYYTLGLALGRFAEPQAAKNAFEQALKLDPKFAAAHVNLALILAQLKEFPSAHVPPGSGDSNPPWRLSGAGEGQNPHGT